MSHTSKTSSYKYNLKCKLGKFSSLEEAELFINEIAEGKYQVKAKVIPMIEQTYDGSRQNYAFDGGPIAQSKATNYQYTYYVQVFWVEPNGNYKYTNSPRNDYKHS